MKYPGPHQESLTPVFFFLHRKEADKYALESKVSRLQFDSVTEQLGAMFTELLNKVTSQERDWHKVIDRLSSEMDCKVSVVSCVGVWSVVHWCLTSDVTTVEQDWVRLGEEATGSSLEEYQGEAAGSGTAGARRCCCFKKVCVDIILTFSEVWGRVKRRVCNIRCRVMWHFFVFISRQLVDRFHCLSCDRPVVKYTHGQWVNTKNSEYAQIILQSSLRFKPLQCVDSWAYYPFIFPAL